MFEGLSNSEISAVLDELVGCLGIKEEDSARDLLAMLRKKDVKRCVQGIAVRLGLPVSISLSYVPQGARPGAAGAFDTKAMARADHTGRGSEAVFAQVIIPQHLPMFGSSALQGYPIVVRVSENCQGPPETFVIVMAHELSHVLLASLHHPEKDSELHADLVPLVLGLRDVTRRGRKTVRSTPSGALTTTRTTTYGYLTDSQFEFACEHVEAALSLHRSAAQHVIQLAHQLSRKLDESELQLATFRDHLRYLDLHPPRAMGREMRGSWLSCMGLITLATGRKA